MITAAGLICALLLLFLAAIAWAEARYCWLYGSGSDAAICMFWMVLCLVCAAFFVCGAIWGV